MLRNRTLLLVLLLLFSFSWLSSSGIWKRARAGISCNTPVRHTLSKNSFGKLHLKAAEAKIFTRNKGYNDTICFFIDMSLPSGQNRFFIYNLKKDSVHQSSLVTHGRCNQLWLEGRKYSNEPGCGCTSLGKYKIGPSYRGRFGLAYKLYGLNKTNSNAYKRFVVLHAHECVPETETEDEICQSDGCPTVSPGFLQQLKPLINTSKKPVLFWIYE